MALSPGIIVLESICESLTRSLVDKVSRRDNAPLQKAHLKARELAEHDLFGSFDRLAPDHSNPAQIERGTINEQSLIDHLKAHHPDLILSYGCSILRENFLSEFSHRILNIHLGLSPYYRGGGTNFWPLVNGAPEFVGVTFMHIDAGIDTGEIIHQMRARIFEGDGPHQIGNRLIADMIEPLTRLIVQFDSLPSMQQLTSVEGREYKMSDLTEDSIETLHDAFAGGLVKNYLNNERSRCEAAPIVENPKALP